MGCIAPLPAKSGERVAERPGEGPSHLLCTLEAEGRASSLRAQGEAEAEIIFKKGEAEAKAMNVKAEAYQEWNQAAVVDRLIGSMPEMVKALAAPLSNVDKITIVSTGDGAAAGAHKVTGDIAAIAAQVPALFEALSGMQLSELFDKVKRIGADKPLVATVVPPPSLQA
jgi:flotillin